MQSKSGVHVQQASVPTVFSAVRMRFLSCWKSSSFAQSELRDFWNFSDSREARDCFLLSSSGKSTKTQKQHMQMNVLYTVSRIIFYTGLMKCFNLEVSHASVMSHFSTVLLLGGTCCSKTLWQFSYCNYSL